MNKQVKPTLSLSLDEIKQWVRPRVSNKRFRHIEGVAEVACQLAGRLDVDVSSAEIAAWLHDCCKEIKDKELVALAEAHGLLIDPVERAYGHLLHGPVAALIAEKELAVSNRDILAAVSEHTLGEAPMSPLSQVLFLADCLEAGRPQEYTAPIWQALDLEGNADCEKAIVVACNLNLLHLIEVGKPIHPKTVKVRNHYLELLRRRD